MDDLYNFFYIECNIDEITSNEEKNFCKNNLCLFIEQLCDLEIKKIPCFSEKQTFLLRKRFGIFDNGQMQTQEHIARTLGITHQAVSQRLKLSLAKVSNNIRTSDYHSTSKEFTKEEKLEQPIDVLDFPEGINNKLKNIGVMKLSQLVQLSIKDLEGIKRFGSKTISIIVNRIHEYGLYFVNEELVMAIDLEQDPNVRVQKILQLPLETLGFSKLAYNALKTLGINTIGQIVNLSIFELKEKMGIGKEISQEIIQKINKYGLCFTDSAIYKQKKTNTIDLHLPIECLNLSRMVYNALKREGINNIEDLVKYDIPTLYEIRRLGNKGILEIVNKTDSLGLKLGSLNEEKTVEQANNHSVRRKRNLMMAKYRNLSIQFAALSAKDEQLSQEMIQISREIKLKINQNKRKIKK